MTTPASATAGRELKRKGTDNKKARNRLLIAGRARLLQWHIRHRTLSRQSMSASLSSLLPRMSITCPLQSVLFRSSLFLDAFLFHYSYCTIPLMCQKDRSGKLVRKDWPIYHWANERSSRCLCWYCQGVYLYLLVRAVETSCRNTGENRQQVLDSMSF